MTIPKLMTIPELEKLLATRRLRLAMVDYQHRGWAVTVTGPTRSSRYDNSYSEGRSLAAAIFAAIELHATR